MASSSSNTITNRPLSAVLIDNTLVVYLYDVPSVSHLRAELYVLVGFVSEWNRNRQDDVRPAHANILKLFPFSMRSRTPANLRLDGGNDLDTNLTMPSPCQSKPIQF
ncbi:hypothetical protein BDR03DRAFT_956976 [Suillus americanus]|nr:hypothetical protein BDR03DRAFT_956976 [Suillus americanus]